MKWRVKPLAEISESQLGKMLDKKKNKGDLLIMMSDGLPEAENVNDEMVGYERTEEEIRSLATRSVEEIKDGLVDLCDRWLDGHAELKDDMTFVIIKKK